MRLWPLGGVGEAIFGPEPGPIVRARLLDDDTLAVAALVPASPLLLLLTAAAAAWVGTTIMLPSSLTSK